jgi:hypothetical protein
MAVEPPIATARTQTRWAPCTAHWDTFQRLYAFDYTSTILLLRLFNPLLAKNVAQSSHIRRLKGSLEYDSRRLIMHNRVTREHLVHSLTAQSTPDIPRPTKKMWHFNMALEHLNELSAHYIRLINLVAPCVVPYACYPRFPRPSPFHISHGLSVTRAPHLAWRMQVVVPCLPMGLFGRRLLHTGGPARRYYAPLSGNPCNLPRCC